MALRREVMLMSEEEVIHFARSKLDQPEKVLLKLEEAEIDGEVLLLCTERNIDKVLPGLAVGPCLKLLNRLQSALEASGSEETQSRSGTSSPVLSARHHDELTLALSPTSSWSSSPQSHVSPSTPRRPRSQSPPSSDQSDAENLPPREGSPQTVRVAPKPVRLVSSTSVPYSGEFPISKLVFGPASQQACRSGIVSREAKSEILQTLHSKIIQLSYDKVYGDRKIREDAAEALVKHYPQLKEGRSSRDAVLSWRNSLTTKGKNVRRGLDLSASPRLLVEKNKHTASRLQAKTGPEDGRKRRKVTVSPLDGEEEEELRVHQQELKGEFLKPKRDRNMRAIKHLSEKTFSLRRKDILEETSHLSQILRDWPALRCADMIIQDLLWIVRIGQTNLRAIPSADILSYADEYALKLSRSHPLLHVLHPHGKAEDDEVINQSIAVATLPYFLPTKVKKTILQTHRYMIDLYPADKPLDEIKTDVSERNQPWILLRGSWSEIERIQVVADGVCVTGANTVHEAIHTVIALHYIQHVEYNRQVKMAMKYLEQVVCGCPRVGYEDYRDITSFVNVLEKRSNCS